MIKFFRKIRQKLLSENKFSKYLFYAIGEIILVVIGILIALQINNWNEQRKAKEIEKEILTQFKEDLKGDITSIEDVEYWMQKVIASSKIVVSHLKEKKSWHDSLAIHFDLWNDFEQLSLNSAGITNLKSRGVELLTNQSLRNQIINLYDQTYYYIQKSNDFFREDHVHMTYKKYLEHIEPIKWRESAIPSDYQKLLEDKEFINHVQWIRNAAEYDSEYHISAINEIKKVIKEIDKELNSD
ncbi:hypothetical protein MTsPCn9_15450 [Croceitalea sp. MTPC9]|uniref:DUF6090 family protein n=1 Tax=unclassified Croceitalea TaxID=2632280 RepID=UPI002B3A4D51|nr:hypothetical protein MTsPCn6_13680 [Croceitalea sp. MTPC6]GMN16609.1 hypothetical protein MTsPCn9_15450 [Croceitalea sp. MTPC9]